MDNGRGKGETMKTDIVIIGGGIIGSAAAYHSPEDGWIDPHAALIGFRKKAESLGVKYLRDRLVVLERSKSMVTGAILQSGTRLSGTIFLNTAGAWAGEIAAMTNAKLPVEPMCRVQHFWRCAHEIEPMPLVKDESGAFFRPEGDGFVGGRPSWDGHYAQNLFDGNLIIGRYSQGLENLLTACDFSGYGIMHAPAVGRALSELALDGEFQTLDLSRMSFQRVLDEVPYGEAGIR
ncbi:MAG: FAD-binding oxidoreductase [Lysobacterales bacterium]|nr:MAG: FAD-binding oxidoreductase [Xanthomonadales bacterium]